MPQSLQPFSVLYSYPSFYLFFSFASSLSLSSLLFSTVTGLCCVSWVAVHEKEGGVRNFFFTLPSFHFLAKPTLVTHTPPVINPLSASKLIQPTLFSLAVHSSLNPLLTP